MRPTDSLFSGLSKGAWVTQPAPETGKPGKVVFDCAAGRCHGRSARDIIRLQKGVAADQRLRYYSSMNLTLLFTHKAGEPPVQSAPHVLPGIVEIALKLDDAKQHLKWLGKSWAKIP